MTAQEAPTMSAAHNRAKEARHRLHQVLPEVAQDDPELHALIQAVLTANAAELAAHRRRYRELKEDRRGGFGSTGFQITGRPVVLHSEVAKDHDGQHATGCDVCAAIRWSRGRA